MIYKRFCRFQALLMCSFLSVTTSGADMIPDSVTGTFQEWYSENKKEDVVGEEVWHTTQSGKEETEEERRAILLERIEAEEAAKRSELERILRLKISTDPVVGGLSDETPVYYITTEGERDYVATVKEGQTYIYYVYISKQGDYFISQDGIEDEARSEVISMMTEEHLVSNQNFWNKVTLMYTEGETISDLPRDANGVLCAPYFNQGAGYWNMDHWEHEEWPDITFDVNGHTMHEAGCGFFSTAMAMSYIKQEIIPPVDFKENGQYIAGEGSAVTVGVESAKLYGISAYMTSDINEVIEALKTGHPVMEHVGQSIFTGAGHYILLVGVLPDGSIAVNDPGHKDNTYWYNGTTHSLQTIMDAAKDQPSYTIFG